MTENSEDRFVRLAEEAQRDYERRVADKRAKTGCYAEDGLYKIEMYEKAHPLTLHFSFVDDSYISIRQDGVIRLGRKAEKFGVIPILMMERWYENGGKEWVVNKLRGFPRQRREVEPHAV